MYQTINFSQFTDLFNAIRPNNFSYDGLQVLFDYLEEIEDMTENGMELDIIAICCDFTESSIEEVLKDYSLKSLEELEQHTLVLYIDKDDEYANIIYQNY